MTFHYDVFRGFNQKEFFLAGAEDSKQGHLLRDHKEYVGTIAATQRTSNVVFSNDHNHAIGWSGLGFEVFKIGQNNSI